VPEETLETDNFRGFHLRGIERGVLSIVCIVSLSLSLSLSLRGSVARSLWTLIASLRFDVVMSLTEYLTAAEKKELV